MEKFFKLKENGTTVRTEVLAGITTFITMAYIIALNPNILTNFAVGTPLWNGVFLATCISSAIGTIFMAFLANKPFVMAPGMGLNTFFATITANMVVLLGLKGEEGYTTAFQAGLCIFLVEGIVFLALSLFNVRDKILEAIPLGVRYGIGPAIGLMLLDIGFGSNAGVYAEGNGFTAPFYVMRDFFGAMMPRMIRDEMVGNTTGASAYYQMVLTVATIFIGLYAIIILSKKGLKSAVLLGMLIASIVYWIGEAAFLGTNPFESLKSASFIPPFHDMVQTTLFKFDFSGFFKLGVFTATTLIITFCMIDMFDTIGTLVGTASKAKMVDKDGNIENIKEALISDAIGTVAGACTGTSTVTTFAESASGVEAGGRTGLTSLTTAILFLASMFLAPIAAIIPAAATSSALIYVGILMLSGLKKINFDDLTQGIPVALMMISIPISGSIGHGIGIGMISYSVICLFTGKAKQVSILTYAISLLFLVKFFLVA